MTDAPKANRGPSAGPENRAALVAAARTVFDELGKDAPLSAIARRAGVGQGSLYRHFPDRASLALAVFDENMEQIEALAARPGSTLREVADLVTHQTEGTAAFIQMATDPTADARLLSFESRLREIFAAKWDTDDDLIGPAATLDDLMLAVGMIAGVVTQAPRERRHEAAEASWALLRRGLAR